MNPSPFQVQSQAPTPWSTGLFDCFEDPANCIITCFCPCITFGQMAEIIDKGGNSCVACGAIYAVLLSFTACPCLLSCLYRTKMREELMLEENPCNDCLVHCCCELCALCQEHRELKSRGLYVSAGWQANAERGNRGETFPPPMQQGMSR